MQFKLISLGKNLTFWHPTALHNGLSEKKTRYLHFFCKSNVQPICMIQSGTWPQNVYEFYQLRVTRLEFFFFNFILIKCKKKNPIINTTLNPLLVWSYWTDFFFNAAESNRRVKKNQVLKLSRHPRAFSLKQTRNIWGTRRDTIQHSEKEKRDEASDSVVVIWLFKSLHTTTVSTLWLANLFDMFSFLQLSMSF